MAFPSLNLIFYDESNNYVSALGIYWRLLLVTVTVITAVTQVKVV